MPSWISLQIVHAKMSGVDSAVQIGRWFRCFTRYLAIVERLCLSLILCSMSCVGLVLTSSLYMVFFVIVMVVQCLVTRLYSLKGHHNYTSVPGGQ